MSFYESYIQLCQERGLKPTPAAEAAGLPKSIVSKWKSKPESFPNTQTLRKLCDYFRVDIDYFLDNDDADTLVVPNVTEHDKTLVRMLLSASPEMKESIRTILKSTQ